MERRVLLGTAVVPVKAICGHLARRSHPVMHVQDSASPVILYVTGKMIICKYFNQNSMDQFLRRHDPNPYGFEGSHNTYLKETPLII